MLFRNLAVWVIGLPVTIILFLFVLASFIFDRSGRAPHFIGAIWSRVILLLAGVRVDIRGVENIPKGAPAVFVSNHQGAFDIFALQSAIPVHFRWIAKSSLFKIPIIGWTMTLAGYIPIEREKAGSSYRSIQAAADRIKGGSSVIVFPEGTRSLSDELLPFKRGSFLLAVRSGAPVVPVAIKGTRDILKRGDFFIRPASVMVAFGKPIPAVGTDETELRERTKKTIEGMLAGI